MNWNAQQCERKKSYPNKRTLKKKKRQDLTDKLASIQLLCCLDIELYKLHQNMSKLGNCVYTPSFGHSSPTTFIPLPPCWKLQQGAQTRCIRESIALSLRAVRLIWGTYNKKGTALTISSGWQYQLLSCCTTISETAYNLDQITPVFFNTFPVKGYQMLQYYSHNVCLTIWFHEPPNKFPEQTHLMGVQWRC